MSKGERDNGTQAIISHRDTEIPSIVLLHSMRTSDADKLADKAVQAHFAFKIQLVHGHLQFAVFIALRCALHGCLGRDIKHRKCNVSIVADSIARPLYAQTELQ